MVLWLLRNDHGRDRIRPGQSWRLKNTMPSSNAPAWNISSVMSLLMVMIEPLFLAGLATSGSSAWSMYSWRFRRICGATERHSPVVQDDRDRRHIAKRPI